MEAIEATDRPEHPEDPRITGCRHVVFHAPGPDGADARAATSIHPGWLDRSPCGTGTCARLAELHARGELQVGDAVRQRVRDRHALHGPRWSRRRRSRANRRSIPEITGRAWITAMGQYLLDSENPFPAGFAL